MRVKEGQQLGLLALLMASLAVYGVALLTVHRPLDPVFLPWGDQKPGTTAVAVTGSQKTADGIYFFPKDTPLPEILKNLGGKGRYEPGDSPYPPLFDGVAVAISASGEVTTIGDLPVVKRLALGLPIDVNRASEEELALVPGIGVKTAVRIVQTRQARGGFETLSDLTTVPGIKENRLVSLQKFLTVRMSPGNPADR